MTTQFVLDALEQALRRRKPLGNKSLIHHSDRGSQYLSIRCAGRLADADIDLSVGTVGDSYDNLWTPPAARWSSTTPTALDA